MNKFESGMPGAPRPENPEAETADELLTDAEILASQTVADMPLGAKPENPKQAQPHEATPKTPPAKIYVFPKKPAVGQTNKEVYFPPLSRQRFGQR